MTLAAMASVRLAETATIVLMQPTTLCNLNCTYCYLPDRAINRRMSLKVADAVAATVTQWSRIHPIQVVWHGGEPMATGLSHFRALLDRFSPGEGHRVIHAIQTNGTLINDAWCELFASHSVEVAVSLDGPGAYNRSRPDRGGRETTERTLRGIAALRRHGIGFGAIAVVAEPTPQVAVELYEFFADLGAHSLGINLEERKGIYQAGSDPGASVVEFWAALAQRWATDQRLRIREFDHAFAYIRAELGGQAAHRASRPIEPIPMITWDGEVVPISPDLAGFSSPRHGAFTVGNLRDGSLSELLSHAPTVGWVAETLEGITACQRSCEYFAYCRGGQAANKYFETGRFDTTQTTYCRNSKIRLMEGLIQHVTHT
jgi:uncharacterized protein